MISIHYSTDNSNSAKLWNDYVDAHPEGSIYHLHEWQEVIQEAFGLKSFYLYAQDNDNKVCGVLPLILSKSMVFGTYLTSIPFYNYGGILSSNDKTSKALLDEAVRIAYREKASHIEFRHREAIMQSLPTKTHKVRMLLPLPQEASILWTGFKSKLRSQIKRAQRENMTVTFGTEDVLDDFYRVFSTNMRDLGTPVWSKKIFQQVLRLFPKQTNICVVYFKNQPIAGGFLHGYKDCMEIPSASAIRAFNRLSPNMLLYWNVLEFACNEGYRYFDFGRSSPDSGTYRFKQQWGAQPETLHWQYWLAQGNSVPEINPQNPKYALAIKIWQKMPLSLANIAGPFISRNLP